MKLNPQINLFSHVSDQDRILLAKHLAVMSKSGISLSESIDTLIQQTKPGVFKRMLQSILRDLENGQSLSKSLAKHPKAFDPFYTNLIEIGEESGNLSKNLEYLASQLEKAREFRSKVKSATLYPAIVLILAVVVGVGVSLFALPKLIDIFSAFEVQLPLNTRILIFMATVMRDYGLLIFGFLLALLLVIRILIQLPRIRLLWHKLLLSMPLIGPILRNTQLTLMCRNLGIMIQGGIPITTALDIQRMNTDNLVYRKYITGIRDAVNNGKTISSSFFSKAYKDIPPIVGKMVDVGEKSGKLDTTFAYLSDYFEGEVDEATKNISVVLEPVLLFVITAIVAFVALAIISPIYELTGSIH
jgi:type II secretory pathway component PulF